MIGPRPLPPEYVRWNRRWGVPNGHVDRAKLLPKRLRRSLRAARIVAPVVGPFGFQLNGGTRRFEYPWAFHTYPVAPGNRVLDLGGGLCGLQFVLDRAGADVVNVDPGVEATGMGWPVTQAALRRLNTALRTRVSLVNCSLQEADLEAASFDRVYSISTLEHVPKSEIPSIMSELRRIVKPQGSVVLTVDLFLNIAPFTDREANRYGTNLDIRWLVDLSGMELVVGNRSELLGYAEFSPRHILANLSFYLLGDYPVVAQALVLQKL